MPETLRLLCVFAHPDDESLGAGGTLARYGKEGVEIYLVTATRGERGWPSDPEDYPGLKQLGEIREGELREAAKVLGIREVNFFEYCDGELDQADPEEVIDQIVAHIQRIQPHVVITFGPDGVYGHPDHIAISQFTTAAVVAAAYGEQAHRVSKLYYMVISRDALAAYEKAFGDLVMDIDGQERRGSGWADWEITTQIDTLDYWEQVWAAISCHCSQLPGYHALKDLPDEYHRNLWGKQEFYRAFSLVNGGREKENDLFAGLR
ncbi:MAG: PIG-L family deacetylase [Anaerolineales bacterium]|nr:PIG-L family deacetylase [Anaerolineales bacterium]